jgi:uncharacterized protein YmfQ (DUF2313 family)
MPLRNLIAGGGVGAPAIGHADLMTDEYLASLKALMPRGAMWLMDVGTEIHSLLRGLSHEFGRVHLRALDLLREADPGLTLELLGDWETAFGLPGECDVPDTEAGRRTLLLARIRGRGDSSLSFFESLADDLGFSSREVRIHQPPRAGVALAGDRCWAFEFLFRFEMVVPLESTQDEHLQCQYNVSKPLHTVAAVVNWCVANDDRRPWSEQGVDEFSSIVHLDSTTKLVAAGDDWMCLSTDSGATWSAIQDIGSNISGIAYDPSGDVVVGVERLGCGVSTDQGASYTTYTFGTGLNNVNGVRFLDTDFYAFGNDNAGAYEVAIAADGTSWAAVTLDSGITDVRDINWNGSLFVAVGAGSDTGKIQTSADGSTWTARTAPSGLGYLSEVHFINGRWLAVGQSGAFIESTDAETWSEFETPPSTSGDWRGFIEAEGTMLLWSSDDELFVSFDDGLTWVDRSPSLYLSGVNAAAKMPSGPWFLAGNPTIVFDTSS